MFQGAVGEGQFKWATPAGPLDTLHTHTHTHTPLIQVARLFNGKSERERENSPAQLTCGHCKPTPTTGRHKIFRTGMDLVAKSHEDSRKTKEIKKRRSCFWSGGNNKKCQLAQVWKWNLPVGGWEMSLDQVPSQNWKRLKTGNSIQMEEENNEIGDDLFTEFPF